MEFLLIAIQVLINVLVLIFLFHYIYRTYKPVHTPILYKEFVELQDNISDLTLELEKISKRSNDDLEKKIVTLEKLIQTADKKIEGLKKEIEKKPIAKIIASHAPIVLTPVRSVKQNTVTLARKQSAKIPIKKIVNSISKKVVPPISAPAPGGEISYLKITEMASKGKSTKEIAKALKMNEGEVQLVMNLQNRNLL